MGNTYDTSKLAETTLELDEYRLPEGMGVGALRHQAARATLDYWDDIRTAGTLDTVRENPEEFLGDAADPDHLLLANKHVPMTYSLRESVELYAQGWASRGIHQGDPTAGDFIDAIGELMVDDLAGWVAQYIRDDIINQTGIDPDAWPENDALQAWGVK